MIADQPYALSRTKLGPIAQHHGGARGVGSARQGSHLVSFLEQLLFSTAGVWRIRAPISQVAAVQQVLSSMEILNTYSSGGGAPQHEAGIISGGGGVGGGGGGGGGGWRRGPDMATPRSALAVAAQRGVVSGLGMYDCLKSVPAGRSA
jgi:hypothetical protein